MSAPSRRVWTLALVLACLSACVAQAPVAPRSGAIGLIGITREIAPIESQIATPKVERIRSVAFTTGTIEGTRVVAARSGVGKVNAAMAATLLVDHFAPLAVIFSGTAGAIDPALRPGDVVIATAVGHHDFGLVTASGFVRGQTINEATAKLDPTLFPADPRLLAAARQAMAQATLMTLPSQDTGQKPSIHEGPIVTGDAFVASPTLRQDLRRIFNASAAEMEGAAVAQVCAQAGVPLLLIRSITDRADGEPSNSYLQNVDGASRNAAAVALATVRAYAKSGRN